MPLFLRTSNLPEAALTNVDLDYQRENVDESIQQYLTVCASGVSVEQFVGFVMSTEIGWFILLLYVASVSYFFLVSSQSSATTDAVSWSSSES